MRNVAGRWIYVGDWSEGAETVQNINRRAYSEEKEVDKVAGTTGKRSARHDSSRAVTSLSSTTSHARRRSRLSQAIDNLNTSRRLRVAHTRGVTSDEDVTSFASRSSSTYAEPSHQDFNIILQSQRKSQAPTLCRCRQHHDKLEEHKMCKIYLIYPTMLRISRTMQAIPNILIHETLHAHISSTS